MLMTSWWNILRLSVAIADQSRESRNCGYFLAFLQAEQLRSKHIFPHLWHINVIPLIHPLHISRLNSTGIRAQSALASINDIYCLTQYRKKWGLMWWIKLHVKYLHSLAQIGSYLPVCWRHCQEVDNLLMAKWFQQFWTLQTLMVKSCNNETLLFRIPLEILQTSHWFWMEHKRIPKPISEVVSRRH